MVIFILSISFSVLIFSNFCENIRLFVTSLTNANIFQFLRIFVLRIFYSFLFARNFTKIGTQEFCYFSFRTVYYVNKQKVARITIVVPRKQKSEKLYTLMHFQRRNNVYVQHTRPPYLVKKVLASHVVFLLCNTTLHLWWGSIRLG